MLLKNKKFYVVGYRRRENQPMETTGKPYESPAEANKIVRKMKKELDLFDVDVFVTGSATRYKRK